MIKMYPEIEIRGTCAFTYHCKSVVPIEEIKDTFIENKNSLPLGRSNVCHYYCKNNKCVVKKNIVKLQKGYFKNMMCKVCESNRISWGFFLIINKLKEGFLLEDDFVYLCCSCYSKRCCEENGSRIQEY